MEDYIKEKINKYNIENKLLENKNICERLSVIYNEIDIRRNNLRDDLSVRPNETDSKRYKELCLDVWNIEKKAENINCKINKRFKYFFI